MCDMLVQLHHTYTAGGVPRGGCFAGVSLRVAACAQLVAHAVALSRRLVSCIA